MAVWGLTLEVGGLISEVVGLISDVGAHFIGGEGLSPSNSPHFEPWSLASSLRADSGNLYSVAPQVVHSFNQMSNCLIAACEAAAVGCFTACTAGTAEW